MTAPTQEGTCDHLATKADMDRLRGELLAEIERSRGEFRAEMERLRADLERGLLKLGIAVISAMGVIAGVVLAVIKLT